jgi:hypothetical protein
MAGVGLGVVALGLATYLLVELRDARRQIAQLSEQTKSSDKRAKELDLALAAVRGQTVTIAQRAGFTAAELEKTAAARASSERSSARAKLAWMRSAARSAR